jgi:katanin p60 ATPase-containing subunit A1
MSSNPKHAAGSDMMLVAKEAAMRPLRRLMAQLEAAPADDDEGRARGSRLGPGGKGAQQQAAAPAPPQELGPISVADVDAALTVTKASARRYEAEYAAFSKEYGQLGA